MTSPPKHDQHSLACSRLARLASALKFGRCDIFATGTPALPAMSVHGSMSLRATIGAPAWPGPLAALDHGWKR
jgi:hypothetical protein